MKRFNTLGQCIPHKHYMADTSNKIEQIMEMVRLGNYFTINRPRQYGKTTTLNLLKDAIGDEFSLIKISFESIDSESYSTKSLFIDAFLILLIESLTLSGKSTVVSFVESKKGIDTFNKLGTFITELIKKLDKRLILLIDEVDKSLNNQLFLDFLALLRDKYIKQNEEAGISFYSVILAGVHDVKNMKALIKKKNGEYIDAPIKNSPWNIAADFDVDMSLSADEIKSMLEEFSQVEKVKMNTLGIAQRLRFYTAGYPFLVSKLCELTYKQNLSHWTDQDIEDGVKKILTIQNTNFESLIKNTQDNRELYQVVLGLLLNEETFPFNLDDDVVNDGVTYGILGNDEGQCKIHNPIYGQRLYNWMTSIIDREKISGRNINFYNFRDNFLQADGKLDVKQILNKFQLFMKEQYSAKDEKFIEREGRLIFLAFLKPIINGIGFDFKEVQISEEKRLDITITYNQSKYVIELKVWRGEKYHEKGKQQISDYLDRINLKEGYIVVFDNRIKTEKGRALSEIIADKALYTVWV